MGVPPNHTFVDGIFPYKSSSYWGTSSYGNPHDVNSKSPMFNSFLHIYRRNFLLVQWRNTWTKAPTRRTEKLKFFSDGKRPGKWKSILFKLLSFWWLLYLYIFVYTHVIYIYIYMSYVYIYMSYVYIYMYVHTTYICIYFKHLYAIYLSIHPSIYLAI